MNDKAAMAEIFAEALAKDLQGASAGAAEYDRKQAERLARQQAPAIPKDNWPADLYRAFYELDLESIRQATCAIPLYKRLGRTFPELKPITEELVAHTQSLLEIYMKDAEYDSQRLAKFTPIRR